jgi:hypothetical protein
VSVALSLLGAIWSFFTDPTTFLTGAAHWTVGYAMPPQLQTWFLGTMGAPGSTWNPSVVYQDMYRVVQGSALLITAVSAAGRVLRASLEHRAAAGHVVLDTVPRLLVALALIGIPGTHVSAGYAVITFAVDSSMTFAQVVFSLLAQASLLQGPAATRGWLDQLLVLLLGNSGGSVLVALALIPLIVLVLYALVLMVLRTVMLAFCVATAPLCFATAVFDVNNRFLRWWIDLFIGVLATPLVLGVAIAVSVTGAASVVTVEQPIGALLAVIVMCGGLWIAAKMVHALTWRQFGHGGALAGFTAGVGVMLGPLHKVTEIGGLAQTFGAGASRAGGGGSGNGMAPAARALSGAAATSLMSGGAAAAGGVAAANVVASGGPPNIAAALGANARTAVAGVEGAFSQRAFNAYARGQPALVGSLTRDLPAGSVASADRARIAWERTPLEQQHVFAEEFLSHWLGSVDGGAAGDLAAAVPASMGAPAAA